MMPIIDGRYRYLTTEVYEISSVPKIKRSKLLNNLKIIEEKSEKSNLWIVYVVSFICILVLLAVIIGVVIYIWNRRTVINKIYGVECKPAQSPVDVAERGSNQRRYWFRFGGRPTGTIGSSVTASTESGQTQQHEQHQQQRVAAHEPHQVTVVHEVQPPSVSQQAYFLGPAAGHGSVLPFSQQSPTGHILPGMVVATTRGDRLPPSRAKNKGLLESRRGSRTSLTLSLSPSADSISSTRSPSPQQRAATADSSEHDRLLLQHSSCRLSLSHLCAKVVCAPSLDSITVSAEAAITELLFQEFWSLPMNHTSRAELSITGMANKNRYRSILPNEKTRVVLPQINENYLSTYINANYIRGYENKERVFIATQGPMPQTIVDFWRMIWHVQAAAIVMLTKLTEKNKRKCEYYLPNDSGQGESYGDITVSVDSITEMDGYVVRQLIVRKETSRQPRLLRTRHYWFTSWPDHGSPSPETTTHLLSLVDAVRFSSVPLSQSAQAHLGTVDREHPTNVSSTSSKAKEQPPVVVHCSAGLGRTGCFLALCTGCEQWRAEVHVDVLGTVARMRLDRGGLVSNNEQYEFLHRALLQYAMSLATSSVSSPSPVSPPLPLHSRTNSQQQQSHNRGSFTSASSPSSPAADLFSAS